jgi:hypothetical protein
MSYTIYGVKKVLIFKGHLIYSKGHMQDFSKGHVDLYRDFEDFYKRLVDKADRIHHAVSLISKYVTHKDTSSRLESISVDFLEMSYMLHPMFGEEHGAIATQITFTILELKTITQGIVIKGILNPESKMLFDRELDKFTSVLSEYIDHHTRAHEQKVGSIISPLFESNFFGEDLKTQFSLPKQTPLNPPRRPQTQIEVRKEDMSFKKNEQENSKGHTVKDIESQGHTQVKKKTDAVDRLNRKTSILNFIKQNKEAQIKDILTHIGDCSEKTIQRELNELIKDGVLKKEGDRRWSKYSLLKDIR